MMRRHARAQARAALGARTRNLNDAAHALHQARTYLYATASMAPLRRVFGSAYAQRHALIPELEQALRTGRDEFVRADAAYAPIASLRHRRAAEHRRKKALLEERRLEELR